MLSALAMLLVAAGVLLWAWTERVLVANTLLVRLGGDLQVQIGGAEWRANVLHLTDVRVAWREDSSQIAMVRTAEWQPEWLRVKEGALGRVKLGGVEIDTDWKRLSGLLGGGESGEATRWSLQELEMDETPVKLRDETGGVLFGATITPRVEGLVMGGKHPKMALLDVRANDVVWRGKPVLAEMNVAAATRDEDGALVVSKLRLGSGAVDLAWLNELPASDNSQPAAPDAWPSKVLLSDVELQNMRVSAEKLRGLSGALRFSWRGRGLEWLRAGESQWGTHELNLTELALRPESAVGGIEAEALSVTATHGKNGMWRMEDVTLTKPVVHWTAALEDALMPKSEAKPEKTAFSLLLTKLRVLDGELKLEPTTLNPLSGALKWQGEGAELEVTDAGVKSSAKQKLVVSDVKLSWGTKEPFLTMKRAATVMVPGALVVDELTLEEPQVVLKPENGPWFDKITTPPVPFDPNRELPLWRRIGFGKLTMTAATLDLEMMLLERVVLHAALGVTTDAAGMQRAMIQQARMAIPSRVSAPVSSVRELEVVVKLPEMWRTRRVESLTLKGAHVDVGDPLMTLFRGPAAVVEEKAQAVAERWTAGTVSVKDIGVTLEEIAPNFPPLHFGVNFEAKETPLDLEGLAENVEPQQVILRNMRIPSPHRPLNAVAEMNEIQVSYTLDGLLRRRIDRVQIVKPLLFVGEDLFWYVEEYRKFMDGETVKPDASVGPVQPAKPKAPGWIVDTLAVSEGSLVVAPKGIPLRGFGKPFPFSFVSKLESGQLEALFEIPHEDRELAHLKLKFTGMSGEVRFNLPMKDKNNNLVETFKVERVQWKNLHAENAHLSITYDRAGIYGSFYAKAYEGDVNGAFDIYLDDSYTWDGWVALTKIRSGPVTKALLPGSFLLEGTVSGKVIAVGDADELYQGDLDFRNHGRGRFEISALNEVIDELPKALRGDLSEQIRRIGLETLRDFEYDSVDGNARFYGREGRGHLRFGGPYGKRSFDVNVYDRGGNVQ